MRQEIEDKIVYLSSLSFDGENPLEKRNSYYGSCNERHVHCINNF